MGFQKGHIPHNKSNTLIFNSDSFLYKNVYFSVEHVKHLYIDKNIQKTELSKILNIPIHILNRIFQFYNLWKPKCLSNKNVVKNTDYILSVEKCKATKMERYNNENYNNRDKYKRTCIERYGQDNVFKTDDFKQHNIKVNQEKYGCDYNSQALDIKEKKKKTCQEHFGVDCPFQSDEVKIKTIKTNLETLGVQYPTQNKEIMDKQRHTNISKYGREYGFDYEKSKDTLLSRYGVEHYTQTLEYHRKAKKHYIYNNESFDSFPELCVYIYAIEHGEPIQRDPIKFIYNHNNKTHCYIPDFLYKGEYVEIKGDHFFKDGKMINPFDDSQNDLYEAKHQCGLQNKVKFWIEKDYRFAINYFNSKNYRRSDYEN